MRAVIICKNRGLFLGTYQDFKLFAKVEDYGIYKAPTFKNIEDAENYRKKYMREDENRREYIIAEVPGENLHVSVVEVIKAGYGEHTGNMISNLPNYHDTLQ